MRVLPIDQRLPIGNFAGRKEIRIAIVPHCRFKAHHRASSKATAFETVLIFGHGHGLNVEFVVTARASLLRIDRSEEHTSELQSLMRISYAVFCLKKKTNKTPIRKDQNYLYGLQRLERSTQTPTS